jgi:hypothetical protein
VSPPVAVEIARFAADGTSANNYAFSGRRHVGQQRACKADVPSAAKQFTTKSNCNGLAGGAKARPSRDHEMPSRAR